MTFNKKIITIFLLLFISYGYSQDDLIPEKFIIHKVKKGDNIYNLAVKYNISESQIESYNPQISKRGLRKRMKIRIPVYIRVKSEKTPLETLNLYYVQPKDTKWRIAYTYGITINELEKLNPEIIEGLKFGQSIKLPNKTYDQKKLVESGFYYYKIKSKEGYYRIKDKTGVNRSTLDSLNPLVLEEGLQEGMILKLPKVFSEKLNIDDNFLVEKTNLQDSIFKREKIKLVYFLPFKTSVIEFDSIDKTERFLKRRTLTSIALDFYSGSILAMEKAKDIGINIDVKIFDTQNNKSVIQSQIKTLDPSKIDVIIGPMLTKNFNFLSLSTKLENVPKVAPLSSNPVEMRKGVFQSITSKSFIRNEMKQYLKDIINEDDNILIVSDSINREVEKELNFLFPSAVKLRPEFGDFLLPELIDSLVVDTLPNKIILETEKFSLISSVSSQIRSQLSDEKKIRLYTTYHSSSYENPNLSNTLFGDLMFTYMSDYYPRKIDNSLLIEKFVDRFGIPPNKTAIRAFDLVFDLILRIVTQEDLYSSSQIGETEYINNKFNYVQVIDRAYSNQAYYLLQHQLYDVLEINK
ncbi:MAG: LysM peptidoglycan-binding domain-containing protein [Flavobacteriaceae bacterium]|nr:LysM peptidoglycan-binding domain-containing protein [Flavobacteriaceae bacterium]